MNPMDFFRYDFNYDWPWVYGHLIASGVFGALLLVAVSLKWPRWTAAAAGLLAAWALTGASIIHGPLRFTRPLALPTERFLPPASRAHPVRVLDAGAGSGRSTVMVLLARPEAEVVALDLFGSGYGIADNTPERLRANARRAGADQRLDVRAGDMRDMPFDSGLFDGVVSAYAIDHLGPDGVEKALAEVARVLGPGGDFLLMVVNPDIWVRIALPFLHGHAYFGPPGVPDRWRTRLTTAGFEVIEQGTRPSTLYFLARKAG